MKGQFMVISSIIIGLMLMSAASTVSEVRSHRFENDPDAYYAHLVKEEAEKIQMSDSHERKEFKKMTEMVSDYRSETVYWDRQNCFNITLRNPETEMNIQAPESSCPN